MNELPKNIENSIQNWVLNDMNPPWWIMWAKTLTALLIGGVGSLFICEQFGYGISPLSNTVGSYLHLSFDEMTCAGICALIFVLLPPLVLRALCTSLQFRVIFRRGFYIAPLWILTLNASMSLHLNMAFTEQHNLIWLACALLFYNLLAWIIVHFEKSFSLLFNTGLNQTS